MSKPQWDELGDVIDRLEEMEIDPRILYAAATFIAARDEADQICRDFSPGNEERLPFDEIFEQIHIRLVAAKVGIVSREAWRACKKYCHPNPQEWERLLAWLRLERIRKWGCEKCIREANEEFYAKFGEGNPATDIGRVSIWSSSTNSASTASNGASAPRPPTCSTR